MWALGAVLVCSLSACGGWGLAPPVATMWLCQAGSLIESTATLVHRLATSEESSSLVDKAERDIERAGQHLSIAIPTGYESVHDDLTLALARVRAAFARYRATELLQAVAELRPTAGLLLDARSDVGPCEGWADGAAVLGHL